MTRPGLLNPKNHSDGVDSAIYPWQLGISKIANALGEAAETGALIRQGLKELAK